MDLTFPLSTQKLPSDQPELSFPGMYHRREFVAQCAIVEAPWETRKPYWNSLPLPNPPGSIAGLLQLIFICLQKIKPSPGKGHCVPKEKRPFMLIPSRNWLSRKKCAGWFLRQPEKELLFFQGDRWVGGQCCVSQELLSSTSTPPQSSVWVGVLRKPTAIAAMKTTDICLLNPFLCGTICYT